MGNESQKPKESLNILLETTGEDLIDALYLAASKPNDNLSIGLLKVSICHFRIPFLVVYFSF